ncbi:hypothetical protein [Streptomyces sp. SAI-090]|uniref:hypothetical protein n=1 Tax=Streptomyces sp. SAI-090 TaxID=2940545 RepID=UPI0024769B5D|nr:hypothetical protein [Streptomyces sp. SAI-090]MDH6522419.1 hypothetical protein [Streptomyces sp. SAI-090]
MTTGTVPPPIKPRALMRATGFDGYVTSDGRYELRPARYGTDRRVRFWTGKDLRGTFPAGRSEQDFPSLDSFRHQYCAPGGRVPWIVCDMDDGVVRVGASRDEAVAWCSGLLEGAPVRRRHHYGEGCYEYVFGDRGEDKESFFVLRADVAHRRGFDAAQQPQYPQPDEPYEQVARPDGKENS